MLKVWTILAFRKSDKTPEGAPRYIDITRVHISNVTSEKQALKEAKKTIKRKGYVVESVGDYIDNSKDLLEQNQKALNSNERLIKLLKDFIRKAK